MNRCFTIKYIFILSFFIFFQIDASAQVIRYVKAGATGTGSSWSTASGDLQAMINASDSGNQVWVARGTYLPTTNPPGTSFKMKAGVKIYGSFHGTETSVSSRNFITDSTIIKNTGGGTAYGIYNTADLKLTPATVLDGFYFIGSTNTALRNVGASPTISNCFFIGNNGGPNTGAIDNATVSSPVITNCTFINNTGSSVGGINNATRCGSIITGCTFIGNNGNSYSGAIRNNYDSALVTIDNCTFNNNIGSSSGAGAISSTHSFYKITNCTFTNNSFGYAGALYSTYDSSASIIANCTFANNVSASQSAGAIYTSYSSISITNCAFNLNKGSYVGAIYNSTLCSPKITNCVFNGNSNNGSQGAGAIYNASSASPTVVNCTFYRDSGYYAGGIYNASSTAFIKIYNSIFWNNYKTGNAIGTIGGIDYAKSSSAGKSVIANSSMQSAQTVFGTNDTLRGLNLFATNPLFVDTTLTGSPSTVNVGLKLKANSPCINSGDNSLLPPNDTTDIAGATRIKEMIVDMGAYESSYIPTGGDTNDVYLTVAYTTICPASKTALPSTIDIPVTVTGFKSLVSLQGSFIWDTTIIKFNSVSSVYPNIGLSSNNFNSSTPGNLLFSWYDNDLTGKTVTDSSTLFTIRFNVAPGKFGKSTLLRIGNQPVGLEAVQYPQKNLPVIPQSNLINFSAAPSTDSSVINGCDSVVFKNIVYKNAIVLRDTARTMNGCDSIYIIRNIQPQHKLGISLSSNSPLFISDTIKLNANGETPTNASISWVGPNAFTSASFNPVILKAKGINSGIYKLYASNACGNDTLTTAVVVKALISGRIITPFNTPVQTVSLLDNNNVVGIYSGAYQYQTTLDTPSVFRSLKNNDADKNNGISSIDILLIQAHILQKQLLNTPYKLIAADVNGSNSITALDLVYIKRVILGLDTTFPGNRLWAFVDSNYVFPDKTNPFPYKDSLYFDGNTSVQNNQTFIGVKLGDVNNDWDSTVARPAGTSNIELYYNDIKVPDNTNQITIPVRVKNFNSLVGLQFTLNFNKDILAFAGMQNSSLNNLLLADNHKADGTISLLWVDPTNSPQTLPDGSTLINLVFTKKASFNSEDISITSDITKIEAWDNNFVEHNIVKTTGKIVASDVIAGGEDWNLFPNPAKDNVKINYTIQQTKTVVFELLDIQGKQISTQTIELPAGSGSADFNLNKSGKITPGQYYIKANGIGDNNSKKIVVVN